MIDSKDPTNKKLFNVVKVHAWWQGPTLVVGTISNTWCKYLLDLPVSNLRLLVRLCINEVKTLPKKRSKNLRSARTNKSTESHSVTLTGKLWKGVLFEGCKKGGRYGLVGTKYTEDLVIVIDKSDPFKFYEKEKQTLKLMYTCHSFPILSELHLKSY